MKIKYYILNNIYFILLSLLSIAFASFLMFSTLGYSNGNILIDSKIGGDFGSHIPLIRSFSLGSNFPPQFPLFSGENIRYHFLFFYLVALLEKVGVRIDIAMNILSTIGLAGLIINLCILAYKVTKSYVAIYFTALFFILNSSFSWIYLLNKGGNIVKAAIENQTFPAIGVFANQIIVSIFWNLNIYTNQRHLAFSFFIMFISIFLLLYDKRTFTLLISSLLISILAPFNEAVFLVCVVLLVFLLISYKEQRKRIILSLILGLILSIPWIVYMNKGGVSGFRLKIGFLYDMSSFNEFPYITNDFIKIIIYWFMNLGILPIVSFAGWILIVKREFGEEKNRILKFLKAAFSPKAVWFIGGVFLFVIANLFSFSVDIINNHKLINFCIYMFDIYAAYFLSLLFKRDLMSKLFSLFLLVFLILGGIVDFSPIINDQKYALPDYFSNPVSLWVEENTPPSSNFFNLTYDTNVITISGRKVFYGFETYTWTLGYNIEDRKAEIRRILLSTNKNEVCSFLKENNLNYIFLSKGDDSFVDTNINKAFFDKNFVISGPSDTIYSIYNVKDSCR